MTGQVQDVDKESFWKEHQDTLVKIRDDLASGKKNSRYTPTGGIKKKTPSGGKKASNHPPFGKYRRTPSPFLPTLRAKTDQITSPQTNEDVRANKFDIVPPLKPRQAFVNSPKTDDYDSWGDETESEDDDDEGDLNNNNNNKRKKRKPDRGDRAFKPQPFPSPMPAAFGQAQVVYGVPFPTVYYPPPPQGSKRKKKNRSKQQADRKPGYKDIFNSRRALASQSQIPVQTSKSRKKTKAHHSLPVFAANMMPTMMVYPPPQDESEDSDQDSVPYDHPLYLPSLYSCEDVLGDQISEMVEDLIRETLGEAVDKYVDGEMLNRDPLEDFLSNVINEAVRQGTREVVHETVMDMAQDYLQTEIAMGVLHNLLDDYLDEIAPGLLEDALFDIVADDFLEREVIIPEIREETDAVARETIQHYDTKIMRKELKEVSQQAQDKLADTIMMDYLLSVMSQQGKLWTETDHYNKALDDIILNIDIGQLFTVQKQRDKTLQSKPLHKLHEKVVSDVALDVFLQQLTRSLDEDLADVDEYERGLNDGVLQPIPLIVR